MSLHVRDTLVNGYQLWECRGAPLGEAQGILYDAVNFGSVKSRVNHMWLQAKKGRVAHVPVASFPPAFLQGRFHHLLYSRTIDVRVLTLVGVKDLLRLLQSCPVGPVNPLSWVQSTYTFVMGPMPAPPSPHACPLPGASVRSQPVLNPEVRVLPRCLR